MTSMIYATTAGLKERSGSNEFWPCEAIEFLRMSATVFLLSGHTCNAISLAFSSQVYRRSVQMELCTCMTQTAPAVYRRYHLCDKLAFRGCSATALKPASCRDNRSHGKNRFVHHYRCQATRLKVANARYYTAGCEFPGQEENF